MATFSAFADEISAEPGEQVKVLGECGIRFLDLRSAWNRNVLDLTDPDLDRFGRILADAGVGVAAIGSPVGKSTIDKPPAYELERLKRACDVAERLRCRYIRIFSFYPPEGKAITDFRRQVFERLASWVAYVAREHPGLVLVARERDEDLRRPSGALPRDLQAASTGRTSPAATTSRTSPTTAWNGPSRPRGRR